MTTPRKIITTPIVGTSVPRVDAFDKVTGTAQFVDDVPFGPGLLHAKLKRSPHPHARIVRIDTRRAEALPGVKAVVTGQDYPNCYIGLYLLDRTVYAVDRVRFVGDPVAAVAAVSEEIAEQAVELIEVEYEPLPGLFNPEEAARPEAPLIHPNLGDYGCAPFILPKPGTNISNHFRLRKGDVEEGFAQSDVIVEGTYRVPHIQHVPMETHVVAAQQTPDGRLTVWSSSQSPFAQRALIAKAFDLPLDRLRVITPYVGGGFGSKAGVSMEGCVVPLAMRARGRPVKLRLTREEEFYTSFVRQGLVAHIKMGVSKEGKILAQENRFYWDAGGYTEYGVNIVRAAGYSSSGPYEVPNLKIDSYAVYTNHPVGGPMRGFGMPEMHFALEQHLDVVAERIGMDPLAFRLKNAIREGAILPTGSPMHPTGFDQCLQKVGESIGWGKKKDRPPAIGPKKRGIGFAGMWKAPAMPPNAGSSATVRLNEDGTVSVGIGGVDIGQGALTVATQFAAEVLGVPLDWVRVTTVDTDYSPYEWQTVASRITWSMGNAIVRAAGSARQQILELVARAWGEDVDDLDIVNGVVVSLKSEEEIPLRDFVVTGLQLPDGSWAGGPILGEGSFMPTYITALDNETGQGERAVVHFTTGAQAVEVEVDTETGEVRVLKVAAAYDVGKAINPDLVMTQIEGGVVQGFSTALFEELILRQGQPVNANLVDYKIATAVDAAFAIDGHIVEVPQDDGPFGARGIGEPVMTPTAPAIANAVYDATGVRLTELPLLPEKVWAALQQKGER